MRLALALLLLFSSLTCLGQEIDSTEIWASEVTELWTLAENHYLSGEYQLAMEQQTRCMEVLARIVKRTPRSEMGMVDFVPFMNRTGLIAEAVKNYSRALEYYNYSLQLIERNEGIFGHNYDDILNKIGTLCITLCNASSGAALDLPVDTNSKTFTGSPPYYVIELNHIAQVYQDRGDYDKAEEYWLIATEFIRKTQGVNSSSYSVSLNNLATVYQNQGNYDKAEEYFFASIRIKRNALGEDSPGYASSLNNLGGLYCERGNYPKAKEHFLIAMDIIRKTEGINSNSYAISLNNLATVYQDQGNYGKAEEYFLASIRIKRNALGEDTPDYASSLNNLGALYMELGNYKRAEEYILNSMRITQEILGDNNPLYSNCLSLLGSLYYNQGDYSQSEEYILASMEIYRRTKGEDSREYTISLNKLGALYFRSHDYTKAEEFFLASMEIKRRTLGEESCDYAISLNNLATVYQNQGNYDKAEEYFLASIRIKRNALGEDSGGDAFSLNKLGTLYQYQGNYEKAEKLRSEEQSILISTLRDISCFMSEKEMLYFQNTINHHFQSMRSFYHQYYFEEPSTSTSPYDLELTIKNMVLRFNMDIRKTIESIGDISTVNTYDQWLSLMEVISRESNLPIAKRRADIDSLENKAEKLEKQLSRLSEGFRELREQVTWDMVQSELAPDEAAIEFSSFEYIDSTGNWTDSTLYTALVLRPEDPYPHMVTLFEQRELDELFDTTASIAMLYGRGAVPVASDATMSYGEDLYDLVWSPLDSLLEGVDRVYFSPSGSLHKLSFSAIPYSGDSLLSDRYDLNRVSSTAVLTRSSSNERPKDMVLFGGMNYSMDTLQMKELAMANGSDLYSRGLPPDLDRGGESWSYLPGTLEEVKSISTVAKDKGIQVITYTGNDALEEQFKALGGDSPDIVHLATHGFFYPDPEIEKRDGMMMLGNETSSFKLSDDPLNRAGILFSGANAYWNGQDVPDGIDNGVLTAKEATYVSLQNTELLVLSACETGLGEIQGSEGVFGLQRAFRASGADNLLMSLWKVPDNETAEFMEAFYGHYFSDNSIKESYQHAQRVMRNKYPNDPYKWAGFVLMR